MPLNLDALTPAQRKAVKWLARHDGVIVVPNIMKGDSYEMYGRAPSRLMRESLLWRSTFKALFYRGWLVSTTTPKARKRRVEEWELTADSLAACGGERLLKAEARANQEAREGGP